MIFAYLSQFSGESEGESKSDMWEVVTATHLQKRKPTLAALGASEPEVSKSEIDDLITALTDLAPTNSMVQRTAKSVPAPMVASAPPRNLLYFSKHAGLPGQEEIISTLEIPRDVLAPADPLLSPALREQLLKLRTTILLAVEQRKLRSVLICSAAPEDSAATVTANLSTLLAEYERLKVAYIEVVEEDLSVSTRRKVLPFGYTFHIRQTKTPNLSEIASSLGVVRLNDWLKWWSPTVVLEEMGKLFNVVLISAPCITTHADVALLAGAVDGVILTATQDKTTYASLKEAQRQLEAAQAHILGVTLSQAPPAASALAVVKSRVLDLIGAVVNGK